MTPTVSELRDRARVAVGRHERVESTAFTKEALAAFCTALGAEIETDRLPPKAQMRATILRRIGQVDAGTVALERPLRKAELEALVAAVEA